MTEASVSFAGNLTDDPEIRYTEGGIARAVFRVAVSGRREQEASFFTVVVWRDQAEHAAESLAKGSRVVVVGRLQQRAWTAEDGSARSVVEVVAEELGAKPAVDDRHASQDHQERWRLATHGGRSPIRSWPLTWPRHGRGTSGNVALLSTLAAFAVPAAFGVPHPLPTVPADATQPGLGHRGLLVGEPFRIGQGHPEGPDAGQHPAAAARLPRP
jgi:single stranded DNA-binding protein